MAGLRKQRLSILFVPALVLNVLGAVNLQISGNTEVAKAFRLLCSSALNTPGQSAYAFFRSPSSGDVGTKIGTIGYFPTNSPRCHDRGITLIPYPFGCENNGTRGYITINVTTGTDLTEHDKYWRCQTLVDNVAADNNMVHVIINDPVKTVQIVAEDGTTLTLPVVISESNTNTKLLCTTGSSGSRPEAQLTWWKVGTPNQQITSGVRALPGQQLTLEHVTARSTLNVANREFDGVSVLCKASLNKRDTQSEVLLSIKFKPDVEVRAGNVSYTSYTITEDQQNVQFTCTVTSANPTTGITYSWLRDGQTIPGVTGQIYGITQIQKADSGMLTCTATNTEGTTTSSGVNINVQYQANITAMQNETLAEGTILTRVCEADGNPQPSFRWTFGGIEVSSSATLRINSIASQQNGMYTCHASNTLTPTGQTAMSREPMATLHVTVYFGPKNVVPSQTHVNITEGQSDSSVSCTATCNPACSYQWLKDSSLVKTGSTLQLMSVSKLQAGNYYCEASNTFLNTPANTRVSTVAVIVNVMYQPSITSLYVEGNNNVVSENDIVKIVCEADSKPASTFTWTRQSDLASLPETGNTLTLSSVQCSDTTFFTCTANNNIGLAATKNVQLFVRCQPRIDSKAPQETAYGAVGESINITVQHIIAFPPPTFLWEKVNSDTLPPSNQTDTITSSTLTVRRLDVDDFGNYSVTIDNNIGQPFVFYIEVESASHPLKPTNVTVIASTTNSVTLSWTPGFDGGATQTFSIQYRRDGESVFSNYSKTFLDDNSQPMTAVVDGLKEGTVYYFRLIATNPFGESPVTEEKSATTGKSPPTSSNLGAIIGGAAGGGLALVLIAGLAVFLIRRNINNTGTKKPRTADEDRDQLEFEDVNTPNSLYKSAGPSNETYAQVDLKKKKKNTKDYQPEGDLYAVVNKSKPKNSGADTTVYENPGLLINKIPKTENDVYPNQPAVPKRRNQDGLIYIDLDIGPKKNVKGKAVIHGLDDATEYAEVAFGKKGPPPPDLDD